MKTFEKIYIGKGTKAENLDIVMVSCKLEDLQAIAYNYDGIDYVTFEVARMKTADNFKRTHTVYYSKMTEVADTPKKAAGKKKTTGKLLKTGPKKFVEPLPF